MTMTNLNGARVLLLPALTAALFLLGASQAGAVTVFSEDFETPGLGCGGGIIDYGLTCQPVSGGAPFWDVTAATNLTALAVDVPAGNTVLGAAGLDGTAGTGSASAIVHWQKIDISAFTNLVLSVNVAAAVGSGLWEADDLARIRYRVDQGLAGDTGWVTLLNAVGVGNTLSDATQVGPNPTALSTAFQNFVFSIPNGSTLRIRLRANVTDTNEQVAFDNVLVQGSLLIPEPSTLFLFSAGLVGFALIRRQRREA